jgi:hypothetical protein
MKRRVLLLEPNYKNKFPPIGLMKLSTYFRTRGDEVVFYKGDLRDFVIQQVVEECLTKLYQIDNSINWKLRADKITLYIKYRKKDYLNSINIDDSEYAILVYTWLEYYKKFYYSGEYRKHPRWDWVGVTTMFTFYWDITIETIEFAKTMVKDVKNLMVGGVLASIQPNEIEAATGIKPHCGTLHTPGEIDKDDNRIIDELPLDYSILDEIEYEYPDSGAFYSYATRGCIRQCPFCAVPIIEPKYQPYLPLQERIKRTRRLFGDQRNLLLMDNNVLASSELSKIIDDIKACGFAKGAKFIEPNQYDIAIRNLRLHINDRAYIRKCFKLLKELNEMKSFTLTQRTIIYGLREKYGFLHIETCTREALISTYREFAPYFQRKYDKQKGKQRFVDFNQGVDARLFNDKIVSLLSEIAIRPLRIAFDNIRDKDVYVKAVTMSVKHGIKDFSNYLLYNFKDKPIDLYNRLKLNVDKCEELGVSIYSFPMKYHPVKGEHSHDRDFIGEHWNRKYIRAIQAILNATKGKVGRGQSFFEEAFGKDENEFQELLMMPETFLLYRFFFRDLGYTQRWRDDMAKLSTEERKELYPIIFNNDFNNIEELTDNISLRKVLAYYKNYRAEIITPGTELYKEKQIYDARQKGGKQ